MVNIMVVKGDRCMKYLGKHMLIAILALGLVSPALAASTSTCPAKSHVTTKKVVKSSHKATKNAKKTAGKCPAASSKKPAKAGSCPVAHSSKPAKGGSCPR
jgi:hypothetical protein